MNTVAIFGGSFNPPTVAHQQVALLVLETCDVGKVVVVPTFRHAFHKRLEDYTHRVAMCERAMSLFGNRVEVSLIESELAGDKSRTLNTLRALSRRLPGAGLRLVVGADILSESSSWYRWDEVVSLAPPIVIARRGYELGAYEDEALPEVPPISSTSVRARLAAGKDAVPLVPRSVMTYITDNGLYR